MNNKIKVINCYFLIGWLTGCAPDATAPQSSAAQLQTTAFKPEADPTKPQDTIQEDSSRDNFDFTQFKGIDWRDPSTFGEPCAGLCVGPTTDPIPRHALLPELGVTNDNYSMVTIKGDGSCWIRSVIQVVLFQAFQNQAVFKGLIDNIKKANTSLQVIPGFSARFRSDDLINLLNTINALTPRERLAQFNKTKVDLFLDYSMRSYLHAQQALRWKADPDLKKILTSHSWGDSFTANVVLSTLLPKEHIYPYLTGFDFKAARSDDLSVFFAGDFNIGIGSRVARTYSEKFRNDKRSLIELEKELEAKQKKLAAQQHILAQSEHPQKKDVMKLISEISPLRLQVFYKEIEARSGINSMADFHRHPSFRLFSYRQYDGHVNLMVHKDARVAFGY